MQVTLQDIANELDVSVMTVSRSLRHDKTIRPETRARVSEAARRMGYKGRPGRPRRPVERDPNNNALGLLMRHDNLVTAQYDTNLMKMMAGIMSVTDEHGMHLKVHPWQPQLRHLDEDPSLLPSMIQEGVCQALIVHGEQDERDLEFLSHRLPVVSMGRIFRKLPIDAAVADNIEGVHGLVTHLVEQGHQKLAWVGPHYTTSFIEERKTGFMKGCLAHNLEINQNSFFGSEIYKGQDIYRNNTLLETVNAGVTGFVCANDDVALRVIRILEVDHRRVPQDVSVTGFDAATHPQFQQEITSLDPHFLEIGQTAARLALQRLARPVAQRSIVYVGGEIVNGDTTLPPKSALVALQNLL